MDELDEFNEAPHIVHGDVLLPPNVCSINDPTMTDPVNNQNYITNGDVSIGLLDDDDEDIVLSTDDLLMGNNQYLTHGIGDNILRLNSDVTEINKSNQVIT